MPKSNVMSPSQNKYLQECADCGSSNIKWISINHAVLICDECCLAHLSLGRCISIIKSIGKSYWPQSLIDTIYELVRNGSAQIWEAHLAGTEFQQMKQNIRKKSSSKDTHTLRETFTKAKYENLQFISKGKYANMDELNQQLMATVKTNNYEACLKLLSQGADANYKSQDDGLSCLHAAVLSSQIGQIELLCIYGADLNALDRNGQTPVELARLNNFNLIADRLYEIQYEVTDELIYFLSNKRPDHKHGQHFFIPDINDSIEQNDMTKSRRVGLQELPDNLLEELCKDVHDEVDRRQVETIWKCTVAQHLVNNPIPFLVIKSCFSQTRNQLRQKLARFSTIEFSNFIIEILNEIKQRYNIPNSQNRGQTLPRKLKQNTPKDAYDDDLLYDRVPSDEDYASVASETITTTTTTNKRETLIAASRSAQHNSVNQKFISQEHKIVELKTNFDKPNFRLNNNSNSSNNSSPSSSKLVTNAELTLNSILSTLESSTSVTPIQASNGNSNGGGDVKRMYDELKSENELMKTMVHNLMEENAQLRIDKMLLATNNPNIHPVQPVLLSEDQYCGLYSTINLTNQLKSQQKLHGSSNRSSPSKTVTPVHVGSNNNSDKNLLKLNLNDSGGPSSCGANGNGTSKSEEHILKIEYKKNINDDLNRLKLELSDSDFEYKKSVNLPITKTSKEQELKITEQQNGGYINRQHSFDESLNSAKYNSLINDGLRHKLKLGTDSPSKTASMSPLSHSPNLSCGSLKLTLSPNSSNVKLQAGASLPSKDTVLRKMKKITKAIQELYKATKESKTELYKGQCEKVNQCVVEMIQLFPPPIEANDVRESLTLLSSTCKNLMETMAKYNNTIAQQVKPTPLVLLQSQLSNGQLSNSSSTSSALSNVSLNDSNDQINNTLVSNMISNCYDIAYTVKKIVCIIGAGDS